MLRGREPAVIGCTRWQASAFVACLWLTGGSLVCVIVCPLCPSGQASTAAAGLSRSAFSPQKGSSPKLPALCRQHRSQHRCAALLPLQAFLALSFMSEGLLLVFHLKGPRVEILVHLILVLQVFATGQWGHETLQGGS